MAGGIKYAAVVFNRQILCCCNATSGDDGCEAALLYIIPQVEPSRIGDKLAFNTHDGMTVHVMVAERGIVFACITSTEFPKYRAQQCLDALLKNFQTANLFSKAVEVAPYGLTPQFGLALQVQMEKYSKPDGAGQAVLHDIQAKVEEVKVVMVRNVQKIIERGDRLEDLQERSENLEMHADQFRVTATRVRKKMWWQNMKMKLIIAAIVLLAIFIIIMATLGSAGVFDKSTSSSDSKYNQLTSTTTTTTTQSLPSSTARPNATV